MGRGSPVHLGRLKSRLHGIIEEDDVSFLPEGSDWPSLMSQALSDAVIELQQRYGKDMDKWRWGQVHRTNPQHILSLLYPDLASLLNPPSFPMSGDSDTPLAASYALAQPFTVMGLSVARYVFDLSDWDKSRWVIPLGASGHPGSTHYADQAPIWADVQLVPMLYHWQRIMENAESRQQLRPM
jgi:penicillin amidase